MDVIIVTGLSGAGKSQASKCLEDLGYYCVDNMPPALIQSFLELTVQNIEKAAFVVDIRGGEFFDDLKTVIENLKRSKLEHRVLFLEASDEILIRRYKETRRSHPLSGSSGSIPEGIQRERKKLEEIRQVADYVVDTSNLKSAQLNQEIKNLILSERNEDMFNVTVESFGYKHGIPLDADMVFDVRFIPNPFYVSSLKNLTGNNKKVQEYVMKFPESRSFADSVKKMVDELIPCYIREGKYNLVLCFGCTGGQHRSVTMANEICSRLKADGRRVVLIHRDL
ncbi:MAG: RNase adapter RapZ [Anaerovoracaceae bacterium]|nr:RNase adapter RapZ [Bacillota bacterium]MDY3954052.1 RNase adapter RapZ [Anaerovoracaceae bacterium]